MTLHVRRAAPGDLDALMALEAQFPGDRLSRRSMKRFLAGPTARLWVADAPGRPVAGAALLLLRRNSRAARLYSLMVDARHRQQGIGRALLEAVENDAAACGLAEVRLEIRADNAAARALYDALGYRPLRTLPGYYDDGADGLRLAKPLTAPQPAPGGD